MPLNQVPRTSVLPVRSVTDACVQRGVDIFVENLGHYLAGEPFRNVVDKEAGY